MGKKTSTPESVSGTHLISQIGSFKIIANACYLKIVQYLTFVKLISVCNLSKSMLTYLQASISNATNYTLMKRRCN